MSLSQSLHGLQGLHGKRVFITGHTGFKGSWLLLLLKGLGCHVTGYSLEPPTSPSLFAAARLRDFLETHHVADIRDAERLAAAVRQAEPDLVIHLAAQALVGVSHRRPLDTFSTNVVGTAALLDAVRHCGTPCGVIVATSDKCYEPHADGQPHAESDPLGGHDPYSASKGAAELVAAAYRRSFFPPDRLDKHGVQLATVRAGNVIGGGDWAEDRIVTDIVRHLAAGDPVPLRNPLAIRPWQHVLEPLAGYLTLAARMLEKPAAQWCTGWNFGPTDDTDITVQQFTELFIAAWGAGSWKDLHDPRAPIETPLLRLAVTKATAGLAWRPQFTAREAIARTAVWYRGFAADPNSARTLCASDIALHEAASAATGRHTKETNA